MMQDASKPRLWTVVSRGWRSRCPRCGQGALFRRWLEVNESCSSCGLVYQRNHGDTWMFMIMTDRIPLLFGIAALYFGFVATTWVGTTILFFSVAIPLFVTLRPRQGVAL